MMQVIGLIVRRQAPATILSNHVSNLKEIGRKTDVQNETGREGIGMSDIKDIEAIRVLTEIANRDTAKSVTVRANDLRETLKLITRLTAERDGVIVEVEHYSRKIERLQSELTKARELIADVVATGGELSRAGLKRYADYLAHNVDESCGRDAETPGMNF